MWYYLVILYNICRDLSISLCLFSTDQIDRFFAALKPLFDSNILQKQTDFHLSHDILCTTDELDFEEISANVYTESAKTMSRSSDCIPCFCSRDDECKESCYNRSMQIECNMNVCPCSEKCQNQALQKQQIPDVVIFKTDKKGFGVKSIKTIEKGRFLSRNKYIIEWSVI